MNNTTGSQEPTQPWYKQFWAWFILAPLIVVIFACAITVSIAFNNKDDVVIDNYYKEGRMINQRFEQDSTAREMGLTGELMFDREVGEVFLTLQSDAVLPEELVLELSHPHKAEYDQQLILKKVIEGRYRADLGARLQHQWYVRILPHIEAEITEAPWRLKGEINFKFGDRVNFDTQALSP